MYFEITTANSILNQTLKTKCMKTIFTLFASLIMGITVFATDAIPASTLTVKSFDNGNIRVVLDGRRFEPGFSSLMIRDIEPGYHQVQVYRQRNSSLNRISGEKYEMVYDNSLVVKPGTAVMISIDRLGGASIDRKKIHNNSYEQNIKLDAYDTHYGYESAGMDSREFNLVLQSISKEWFESNRLKSATQIVTANSLTTAQVKQLILLFNFESNKLDLAKKAYQNTVDKNNYYMINDVFSFNNSKDELARYIHN
jgi:Domain of unknown function (DUF4476)